MNSTEDLWRTQMMAILSRCLSKWKEFLTKKFFKFPQRTPKNIPGNSQRSFHRVWSSLQMRNEVQRIARKKASEGQGWLEGSPCSGSSAPSSHPACLPSRHGWILMWNSTGDWIYYFKRSSNWTEYLSSFFKGSTLNSGVCFPKSCLFSIE